MSGMHKLAFEYNIVSLQKCKNYLYKIQDFKYE